MRSRSCFLNAAFYLTALGSAPTVSDSTPSVNAPAGIPQAVPSLVGTWEATGGRLRTGIVGTTLIFSAEGTVTAVVGVMFDGKYKLEGNQLRVDAPGAVLPSVQTVAFVGDTALITGGTNYRKLIPFGETARPNSLIGQWRWIDVSTGVTAYEVYTSEGTWRLRTPAPQTGSVAKGFYSVRGNMITMRYLSPRTEERSGPFTLRGDTLTIRWGDGKAESFVRARPLLPTDVEQPGQPIR